MTRTHCASGHALIADNIVHHRGRRRCRLCHKAAQERAYKARKLRQRGVGSEELTQTAIETMDFGRLAARIDQLTETLIPELKVILDKSTMFATRAERKADRLHKRMLQDEARYDEAVQLSQRATEAYERRRLQFMKEHPDEEAPF